MAKLNATTGPCAEFAYARPWTSEIQRSDYLQRWLIHDNYHRAHTATGNQPPATLAPTTVTNVMNRTVRLASQVQAGRPHSRPDCSCTH